MADDERDAMALKYKQRVTQFLNEMTKSPVVEEDQYV